MIEFITGVAVGVAGMVAKDKLLGNDIDKNLASKQQELDSLYAENEKVRKRNKEMERQIEDLLDEAQKLRRQFKEKDDDHDDLEEDIQKARRDVKQLTTQNDELMLKLREYKAACENYELEIERLKDKLG